jgi:hypothetical protein
MAPEEARQDAPVTIRAFRGTRRTSVYRDHVVNGLSFARIVEAGEQRGLSLLASLGRYTRRELDKQGARRLADELTRLRASGELIELDHELVAATEVASWCSRARGRSWLHVTHGSS